MEKEFFWVLTITSPPLQKKTYRGKAHRLLGENPAEEIALPSIQESEILEAASEELSSFIPEEMGEEEFFNENSVKLGYLPKGYNAILQEEEESPPLPAAGPKKVVAAIRLSKANKARRKAERITAKAEWAGLSKEEKKARKKEQKEAAKWAKEEGRLAEVKRPFSIWEEVEPEYRSKEEKAVWDLVNYDGYYDTLLPKDYEEEEQKEKIKWDWRIVGALAMAAAALFAILFLATSLV